MLFLGLAGLGIVLGLFLTLVSRYRGAGESKLAPYGNLFLRLLVLGLVVGLSARRFGPAGGLTVLGAALFTRAFASRGEVR